MGKKLIDGRKPGTGLNPVPRKTQLQIGSYKIYDLCEDNEPFYVGVTLQYMTNRFAYHKHCAKKNYRGSCTPVSMHIKTLLHQGKNISINLIEMMPSGTTKHDAYLKENFYIEQYRKEHDMFNVKLSTFIIYQKVGNQMTSEEKNKIKELHDLGMNTRQIKEQTGLKSYNIDYCLYKWKINKKVTVQKEVDEIKVLYESGSNIKEISQQLNLSAQRVRYRILKLYKHYNWDEMNETILEDLKKKNNRYEEARKTKTKD